MSRITHPRPEVGRQRHLGITFFDGFADYDLTGQPELVESLLQHGFLIEDAEPPAKASKRRSKGKPAGSTGEADAPSEEPAVGDSVVTITIDGEHFVIPADSTLTAADLLELASLNDGNHDVLFVETAEHPAGVVIETTPAEGAAFITAAISAGN